MTVKTDQLLQDGGALEYVYHETAAWLCAVFVDKIYGSKRYPQRNFHLFGPLKQHLSGERFPDDDSVERPVWAWFRQQPQEF